jgi:RPA family protein
MDASEIVQQKKRQTALRLRIADLNRGEVISNEKMNFVEIDGKYVGRVNVIANVIDKFVNDAEKKYAALTIDDASSQIRVKSFGDDISKIKNIEIGDTIVVIGAPRFFNNEIYILPEIIRKTEPEWLLVRKLEIEKNSGSRQESIKPDDRLSRQLKNIKPTREQEQMINSIAFNKKVDVIEEKIELSAKDKIMDMLKKSEDGVDVETIIMSTNLPVEEINNIIAEMLENAEIYEPKPGRIRIL